MSTRRDFLRLGATTGAGLAAARLFGQTGFTTPARKVRIGIVGGRFGLGFQFHEHPDCVVEAVAELRPERLAALQVVEPDNQTIIWSCKISNKAQSSRWSSIQVLIHSQSHSHTNTYEHFDR